MAKKHICFLTTVQIYLMIYMTVILVYRIIFMSYISKIIHTHSNCVINGLNTDILHDLLEKQKNDKSTNLVFRLNLILKKKL